MFLAPMGAHHAIAFEAYQAVAHWDAVTADDGTVNAVRVGAPAGGQRRARDLADRLRQRLAAETPGHGRLRRHHAGRRTDDHLHAGTAAAGARVRQRRGFLLSAANAAGGVSTSSWIRQIDGRLGLDAT